ncbi:hypothetical protein FXW78_54060 [Rhodococcus opacus]|nr:hypothetical protein [Rhodococcus opacus]
MGTAAARTALASGTPSPCQDRHLPKRIALTVDLFARGALAPSAPTRLSVTQTVGDHIDVLLGEASVEAATSSEAIAVGGPHRNDRPAPTSGVEIEVPRDRGAASSRRSSGSGSVG